MEAVINFMSLSEELNDDEFNVFQSEGIELFDDPTLQRLLFEGLGANIRLSEDFEVLGYRQFKLQRLQSLDRLQFKCLLFDIFKRSPNDIIPFTNILAEIMKNKPKNRGNYGGLDLFNASLIAPYLDSKSYHSFGRISRDVYVACFSPCQLLHVSLKEIPSKVINRYKHIKSVQIESVTNKYRICSIKRMSQFKNVKDLSISGRALSSHDIFQFSALQTLKLHNVWIIDGDKIKKDCIFWPKLKSIQLTHDNSSLCKKDAFANQLVHIYCCQLESIRIEGPGGGLSSTLTTSEDSTDLSVVCLWSAVPYVLKGIADNAKRLRTFMSSDNLNVDFNVVNNPHWFHGTATTESSTLFSCLSSLGITFNLHLKCLKHGLDDAWKNMAEIWCTTYTVQYKETEDSFEINVSNNV